MLAFGLSLPTRLDLTIRSAFAKENPSIISQGEFLASDFPKFFKKREFQKALDVIDSLLKKYPSDVLILRYRALTLDKLGRRREAIAGYKQILTQNPNHAPTHLFLGLAYARDGKSYDAEKELRWVVEKSGSEEYRHWAQAQLTRLRQMGKKADKKVKKKPYLLGKIGAYYDSNPLLIPDDKGLTSRSDKDGVDFPINVSLGYPLVLEKDLRVDALYINQELIRDGGASDVNFISQGFALDAKKRKFFGGRAFLFGARYDVKVNFLRDNLFSAVNRFLLSADTALWPKTRTHLYARYSYSNYGPDGSEPSRTSRDGSRGGWGFVQYFYTPSLKAYFFSKEEVSFAETRGDNFDRWGSLTRLGIHTPLDFLGPADWDVSTGFDYGAYPEFSSLSTLDLGERRDKRLDVYTALTYHWRPSLATRAFYRFIYSSNESDFFDRKRHIAGMEVIFSL